MEIGKTGNVWHSPNNVYRHLGRLAKLVEQNTIESGGKYKRVREARTAAVVALAMYKQTERPTYVQLPPIDPPDALLMQQSTENKGWLDITTMEITTYRNNNNENLLGQLIRTKVGGPPKYSDEYLLVVELLSKQNIDYDAIRQYLNDKKVQFPVWTIFGKSVDGSTTAELVIINPKTIYMEINIGEAANNLKISGAIDVFFTKRTANEKNVRTEPAGNYEFPPWEGLI